MLTEKTLRYVNQSPNPDPVYKCIGDSGFDVRAWIDSEDTEGCITLKPLERRMVHTGLYFELPVGTELQIRPRSGLSFKQGLTVINTPGTLDENYRGELCILVINLSENELKINNGDRIAQAVLMPVYNETLTTLLKIEEINIDTERGTGGFGHTGVN